MSAFRVSTAVLALSLGVLSLPSLAVDHSAAVKAGQLGSAVADTPAARTIKLAANAKAINVKHGETVKIVNAKGQSFTWQFDTLSLAGFPLKTIAPADFDTGGAWVFLQHPAEHTTQ